jgi:hypothetical protein
MSGWLWGKPTIAKICPKDTFYFITSEHNKKGWFQMKTWNTVQVTDKSVCEFPKSGQCVAVCRNIMDKINPLTCFTARIRIWRNGATTVWKDCPLSEIMNNVTFGNSQEMTWAMIAAGQWCVDMGSEICCVSNGNIYPKFDCKDIMEKMCHCMNEAIFTYNTQGTSEMSIASNDGDVTLRITIGLSDEFKTVLMGKDSGSGSFKISEKVEPVAPVEVAAKVDSSMKVNKTG